MLRFNIAMIGDNQMRAILAIAIALYFYLMYREIIIILKNEIRKFYNSFSKNKILFFGYM